VTDRQHVCISVVLFGDKAKNTFIPESASSVLLKSCALGNPGVEQHPQHLHPSREDKDKAAWLCFCVSHFLHKVTSILHGTLKELSIDIKTSLTIFLLQSRLQSTAAVLLLLKMFMRRVA